MDRKSLEEAQEFLDSISTYQFFTDDGVLDLEFFCLYLTTCFAYDGLLEIAPSPHDIHSLLIEIIRQEMNLGEGEDSKYIVQQNLLDWTPDHSYVYPNKYRTCIGMAALTKVHDNWISNIGHYLMGIPESTEVTHIGGWIKPEWVYVRTFINGFLTSHFEFIKQFDKSMISKKGYSMLEALHLSVTKEIDFDNSVNKLKSRKYAQDEAVKRIVFSIEQGFFLEAITLQECLISNCLYNYLSMKSESMKSNYSLHKLLETMSKEYSEKIFHSDDLLARIDLWRKNRNEAVHGFISSKLTSLNKSREEFSVFSEKTAEIGIGLCKEVIEWYEQESVSQFTPSHELSSGINYQS